AYDITIEVKEQSSASISVGAGLDSATGFFGSAGITDNNFLGRGQRLGVNFLAGTGVVMSDSSVLNRANLQAEINFFEPYFLNADNSLMSKLYYRELGSYQIPLAMERRIGIESTIAHRLKNNRNMSSTFTIGGEYINLDEGDKSKIAGMYSRNGLSMADRAKQLEGGFFLKMAPGLAYDSRDSVVNPRHGVLASVRYE
ncbi:BamA/TamA family outer membrane protein, partial [bacterium]|nr:BamA/TamA family outer membrane protein [bacterium]